MDFNCSDEWDFNKSLDDIITQRKHCFVDFKTGRIFVNIDYGDVMLYHTDCWNIKKMINTDYVKMYENPIKKMSLIEGLLRIEKNQKKV